MCVCGGGVVAAMPGPDATDVRYYLRPLLHMFQAGYKVRTFYRKLEVRAVAVWEDGW